MNFSLSDLTYKTPTHMLTIPDPVSNAGITNTKPSSEIYLRDARAGKIKKAAKQRLSVIGADGGCGVGKQVVVKHALPEKLVKKPGWVRRAQGASEPGVLDGDIHGDNRQFGLTCCGGWTRSGLLRCPAGEGKEVMCAALRNLRVERLQGAFGSTTTNSFYTREAEKRGFSHNPSGMTLSHGGLEPVSRIGAEDELVMDGRGGWEGGRGVSL